MTDQLNVIKNDLNATIEAFEKFKEVATYLATSDAFTKGFEMKDKDGKDILDETTGKPKINTADVAVCLMAGNEIGLSISGSLLYGKKLNQATYMSVIKGRSMGVDVATAIEKIISIPTKNGYVSYTMVDIISAKLLQGGVSFLPFVKNYAPFYIYRDANNNELELDKICDEYDDLKDDYRVVNLKDNAEAIKASVAKIKEEGKIVVTKEQHGYYSKAKFVRTFPNGTTVTHFQRFSTIDAERAGLLPTYQTINGKIEQVSNGKDNWISNTPQMMNNRVISIGGRIIGADLINGVYTREEVISSGLIKEEEAPIVDSIATVI